ncbi:MAG: aminoacyl-tRNA hydrolase [Candidatus Gracilibacteria bacterium]|nr:aminoacyl-tRNA hydrolase [Candidatus Gracilibacteria bacterium]
MKIIVGLGNPGIEYQYTKHNVGFLFLDYLASKNDFSPFKNETKFKGEIRIGEINGEKIILLKPSTFMNLSGESLKEIINFYKMEKKDFIVIFDDLSMDFGKIRFRENGSAGGHNGVKSIIKYFGENFKRIKVGIGFNSNFEVSDWVLSKFTKTELDDFDKNIFQNVEKLLLEKI